MTWGDACRPPVERIYFVIDGDSLVLSDEETAPDAVLVLSDGALALIEPGTAIGSVIYSGDGLVLSDALLSIVEAGRWAAVCRPTATERLRIVQAANGQLYVDDANFLVGSTAIPLIFSGGALALDNTAGSGVALEGTPSTEVALT